MAPVTGITSVKKFTYRDDAAEQWSNTYWFRGPVPGTYGDWKNLVTSLWAYEKSVLDSGTHLVAAIGYATDNPADHAVFSWDAEGEGASVVGTYAPGAGEHKMAGDQAAKFGWYTDKKNTKGKSIYLNKYVHGGYINSAKTDELSPAYIAAGDAFCQAMCELGAAFHGGVRSQRQDANVLAAWCEKYVTTRTLERRGKRPKATP